MNRLDERRKAEADHACEMVLKIVRHLVQGHKLATRGEPTGIHVAPEMRQYVDRGAD